MAQERQEDLFDPERRDPEGLFDAQLPLPIPSITGPEPFRTIVKRDGRHEPFAKEKIARTIALAAQCAGRDEPELADSLAAAVAIFLFKRLGSHAPSADQVSDAVERVLIEMSQGETALAYARYRDRRARIRRLRDGDTALFLRELEEARNEREALSGRRDSVLSVRISSDRVTRWDRERIVAALVRETGLESSAAAVIAMEVERQIEHAGITTLTSSLIRELVDAKLVEHGLGAYRERHRRLGVPLFDCDNIIRGTGSDSFAQDPVGTDQVLARAVKREYGLTQIFSAEVAEAHLQGDLHLHHLGLIDRLFDMEASSALVARFGLRRADGVFAEPPRDPHALLAQWTKCHSLTQRLFAEPLSWDAVNYHFAPFLGALEGRDFGQFAQTLVYEFVYRALADGPLACRTELGLYWTVPAHLRGQEALGPGGAGMGVFYAHYETQAQRLALAIVDVLQHSDMAFPGPVLVVHIAPQDLYAPDAEIFLEKIAGAASLRRNIHLTFDAPRAGAGALVTPLWRPRRTAFHQVSLNLSRAALTAGSEPALWAELDRLVTLAIQAHEEKRRLLEALIHRPGGGPLALLALETGYEEPWLELDDAVGLIAAEGLNECVQAVRGESLHESAEALDAGMCILAYLQKRCEKQNATPGVRVALTQNHEGDVSRRFATLDMQAYPDRCSALVKRDPESQSIHYTTGARIQFDAPLQPFERVRQAGALHGSLDAGALTEVVLPLPDASEGALRSFIRKTAQDTRNRRIVFV